VTGNPTAASGRYAVLHALCVSLLLVACGAPHEAQSTNGSSQPGGDYASSGGDAYEPDSYEASPEGPMLMQTSGAAPASAPAPSGEMVVTGSRTVSRLERSVHHKAKAASDVDALASAPPSLPATPASPERDTSEREQHGLSLIYDAHVHLGVYETQRTIDAAETLAREAGGYLVHRDDRRITFRVPTAKFETTMAAVLVLGDVLHRQVSVRDVTEEFRDLRIRLRNAEVVRERLEQLLARADKVEQALAVESQLERVAGEIEQIKGRLAMLQELIAFSTVTVELRPRATDRLDSRVRLPFPWLDELGLAGLLSL
jgi:hypothetical protein